MKKIFLALFISFCFFVTAYAVDFGGIGGKPANPNPNQPNSKAWFIYELKQGQTQQDAIEVQNNQDQPAAIILYPADSVPSTDGGFALKQKVEPQDFVGKWIKLSQNEVNLGPHQSTVVPFTIAIPQDPQIDVGEHTGGILLQKANDNPENAEGMQLFTRVGVRVYVTIPGQIIEKLDITKFNVTFNPQRKVYTVSITVQNSGNVSQDIDIKLNVTNVYPWLNTIPWINQFFKNFPLENERDLQVLRDDALTSNFEFPQPLFGKLQIEGTVFYDNKTKSLSTEPLEVAIPVDTNIIILFVLIGAFLLSLVALLVLHKKEVQEKNSSRVIQKKRPSNKKQIFIPPAKNIFPKKGKKLAFAKNSVSSKKKK